MAEACPNCGKPVLATDTVCWHCGYALPKRTKARLPETTKGDAALRLPPRNHAPAETQAPAVQVEYDFRALTVYSLLTLAIILGLWLVMRSLGGRPILVRSAAFDLGGDWVAVTDGDLRYTLSLPTEWQWIDLGYRDQAEMLDDLEERQRYIGRALQPWGEAEIVAVGVDTRVLEETDPKTLIVVGRADSLSDLTPEGALELAARQPLPITETEIDTRLVGQSQARFNALDDANAYQCRHLFVAGDATAYLVAACASQARFAGTRRVLDDILDSFQLLEH